MKNKKNRNLICPECGWWRKVEGIGIGNEICPICVEKVVRAEEVKALEIKQKEQIEREILERELDRFREEMEREAEMIQEGKYLWKNSPDYGHVHRADIRHPSIECDITIKFDTKGVYDWLCVVDKGDGVDMLIYSERSSMSPQWSTSGTITRIHNYIKSETYHPDVFELLEPLVKEYALMAQEMYGSHKIDYDTYGADAIIQLIKQ